MESAACAVKPKNNTNMPTKIFKYLLSAWPNEYMLPQGAVFLTVQTQYGEPQMWFEVDPNAPLEKRRFAALATGESIHMPQDKRKYLGTFQLNQGTLVFHVFELL